MRIVSILLFIFIIIGCDSDSDSDENITPSYTLELRHPFDRITFTQIALPDYLLDVSSQNETFILDKGMSNGVNDIRVTLSYEDCEVGNQSGSKEVIVNFYEDSKTVLEVKSILICSPTILVLYE